MLCKKTEIFKFHIEKGIFSSYYAIHFTDGKKLTLKRNRKNKRVKLK
jgi:hypothetical protein